MTSIVKPSDKSIPHKTQLVIWQLSLVLGLLPCSCGSCVKFPCLGEGETINDLRSRFIVHPSLCFPAPPLPSAHYHITSSSTLTPSSHLICRVRKEMGDGRVDPFWPVMVTIRLYSLLMWYLSMSLRLALNSWPQAIPLSVFPKCLDYRSLPSTSSLLATLNAVTSSRS